MVRVHPSPVRFKCRFTYQTPEKYEANKIANSPNSGQRVRVSHKSSTKKQKILITSKFLSPEPGRASSRGRNGSNAWCPSDQCVRPEYLPLNILTDLLRFWIIYYFQIHGNNSSKSSHFPFASAFEPSTPQANQHSFQKGICLSSLTLL